MKYLLLLGVPLLVFVWAAVFQKALVFCGGSDKWWGFPLWMTIFGIGFPLAAVSVIGLVALVFSI